MSRSFSAWGRLTISPRLATAARSAAAFGFGWHGGGGCSARTVFRVNATRLSIANSDAHRVMLAGLVLIFFIGSYALVRFIFSPLVIEISFELKFFPADDWTWRKSAAYRSSRGGHLSSSNSFSRWRRVRKLSTTKSATLRPNR